MLKIGLLATVGSGYTAGMISALETAEIEISAIIFDSKPIGPKDIELWNSRTMGQIPSKPLHELCSNHTPFYFVESHNSESTVELVKALKLDILINADTPRILQSRLLESVATGVLNVHPGILPYYKGCSCVEWAILNDDRVGNTAHFMTESIDCGPIIMGEATNLHGVTTYIELRTAVYLHSFNLAAQSVKLIASKQLTKDNISQQPDKGRYHPPIDEHSFKTVLQKIENHNYHHLKE